MTDKTHLGVGFADGRLSFFVESSSLVSFSLGRPLPLLEFLYLFFFAWIASTVSSHKNSTLRRERARVGHEIKNRVIRI